MLLSCSHIEKHQHFMCNYVRQAFGQFSGQFCGHFQSQFLDNFRDSFMDNFRDDFQDSFRDNFGQFLGQFQDNSVIIFNNCATYGAERLFSLVF